METPHNSQRLGVDSQSGCAQPHATHATCDGKHTTVGYWRVFCSCCKNEQLHMKCGHRMCQKKKVATRRNYSIILEIGTVKRSEFTESHSRVSAQQNDPSKCLRHQRLRLGFFSRAFFFPSQQSRFRPSPSWLHPQHTQTRSHRNLQNLMGHTNLLFLRSKPSPGRRPRLLSRGFHFSMKRRITVKLLHL